MMRSIVALFSTLLIVLALTVSASESGSKDKDLDKRMIYWKRGVLQDMDEDGMFYYLTIIHTN